MIKKETMIVKVTEVRRFLSQNRRVAYVCDLRVGYTLATTIRHLGFPLIMNSRSRRTHRRHLYTN